MATINGITIKTFRTFSSIEYPTIREANVYQKGKKIGTYREDEWGGESHYTTGLYEIIRSHATEFQKGCNKDSIYYEFQNDPDIFMGYLLTLAEYEKYYKSYSKKGAMHTLFIGNDFKWMSYGSYVKIDYSDESKLHTKIKDGIKREFPKGGYVIWSADSLDDFNITVDENHPIPEYLKRRDNK